MAIKDYAYKFGWQFRKNIEDDDTNYGKSPVLKVDGYLKHLKIKNLNSLQGKKLLIAGVGAGKELKYMNKFGWKITGIDLHPEKAMETCKGLENVEIKKYDIKDFTSREKFDYVICVGVLHHTPNPKEYFDNLMWNLGGGAELMF